MAVIPKAVGGYDLAGFEAFFAVHSREDLPSLVKDASPVDKFGYVDLAALVELDVARAQEIDPFLDIFALGGEYLDPVVLAVRRARRVHLK